MPDTFMMYILLAGVNAYAERWARTVRAGIDAKTQVRRCR
jgi:hypothetical protein